MTALPDESKSPPQHPLVLIVDDEPDQLGLLTTYFTKAGCAVIALPSAEQALELPIDIPLDLILLDLVLPRIDGWELTKLMRERYPHCPVAITSILEVEHYPEADAMLPKPVTRAQIHQILASTIPFWNPR